MRAAWKPHATFATSAKVFGRVFSFLRIRQIPPRLVFRKIEKILPVAPPFNWTNRQSRVFNRNGFATQLLRKRFPHRTPLCGYAEKRFRPFRMERRSVIRAGRGTFGECRFRIAAERRPMRIDIRPKWRRRAIAVYFGRHQGKSSLPSRPAGNLARDLL